MKMFYAIWIADGTERLVPSRKHNFHRSVVAAARALERRARRHPTESRGIVKDSNGHWVLTIAL
ncbi:MAG: hypothetical protein QMC81_10550 [Thermoanaerobacterales bacterium]|nr:hypothetical protein [Thermoanaerobacterales bacterium]